LFPEILKGACGNNLKSNKQNMKKILVFLLAVATTSVSIAQHFDTITTIRKVYHLKSEDGIPVDSIVEITVKPKQTEQKKPQTLQEQTKTASERLGQYIVKMLSRDSKKGDPWHVPSYNPSHHSDLHGGRSVDVVLSTWKRHPELRPGEMFLTNMDKNRGFDGAYTELAKYKTLRKGKIAYSIRGNKVPSSVPVFVSIEEYQKNPLSLSF
jgi:hypothetical protein